MFDNVDWDAVYRPSQTPRVFAQKPVCESVEKNAMIGLSSEALSGFVRFDHVALGHLIQEAAISKKPLHRDDPNEGY